MGIYFILCVQYNTVYFLCTIQYNCYFAVVVPQIILALGTGSSFQFDSYVLLTFFIHFWLSFEHLLPLHDTPGLPVCLQGIPISSIGEWYVKTKPWALKLCLLVLECHCFWALSVGSIYVF